MRTVIETAALVRGGEMKSTEALDETLAAIDRHNGELNSFVHLDPDLARCRGRASRRDGRPRRRPRAARGRALRREGPR